MVYKIGKTYRMKKIEYIPKRNWHKPFIEKYNNTLVKLYTYNETTDMVTLKLYDGDHVFVGPDALKEILVTRAIKLKDDMFNL